MDDRHPALENSSPLEPFIDRFAKELVQERIGNGHIDLKNMSFAEMEMLSHQISRRVAQHLGHEMTGLQAELYSDDYNCPTCGLDCEAIQKTRTIYSIASPWRQRKRILTREIDCGSGTHCPAWKESKTALFMRMSSDTHENDPAPEPPESLQNRGDGRRSPAQRFLFGGSESLRR